MFFEFLAEVRSYIMDLLLELVFVHEEVHSTAKGTDKTNQIIIFDLRRQFCCKFSNLYVSKQNHAMLLNLNFQCGLEHAFLLIIKSTIAFFVSQASWKR